jgi:hypothetical protein
MKKYWKENRRADFAHRMGWQYPTERKLIRNSVVPHCRFKCRSEGSWRFAVDDRLIIGALGILFLIVIQPEKQQSPDIPPGLGDQTIVSSYSQQN